MNFRTLIGTHGATFAVALAVGAVLALGIRSTFAESKPKPATGKPAAPERHAASGHEGAPADAGEEKTDPPAMDHGEHSMESDPKPDPKEDDAPVETIATGVLLELGNTECPVMGGTVDGKVFSEWNGLRVGHCCAGCGERFLKNPEALLDTVSPTWREAAAAVERVRAAEGEARDAALAAAAAKWKVLRK